jgi:hypothetical protein
MISVICLDSVLTEMTEMTEVMLCLFGDQHLKVAGEVVPCGEDRLHITKSHGCFHGPNECTNEYEI